MEVFGISSDKQWLKYSYQQPQKGILCICQVIFRQPTSQVLTLHQFCSVSRIHIYHFYQFEPQQLPLQSMDLSHDIRYAHVLKDGQDAFRDASRKKGRKPITRPSRWDLINNQLKHQNDGDSDDVESQINIISHKFPPSVAPLLGLTKTYIGELLLEINHRGSYLLLRTIAPPIKMMEIISAVEDEKGGCESIILHNMDKNRNWRKILPEGVSHAILSQGWCCSLLILLIIFIATG